MDLKAGPSLPWNFFFFFIDTQKFESITRNKIHKAEYVQMSSRVDFFFSGKVYCGLDASCILKGGGD